MEETIVATVPASAEAEQLNTALTIVEQAQSVIIANADQYKAAAELGREIKRQQKSVKEFFAPIKDAANKAHKSACEREKTMLEPLKAAEKAVKDSMGKYTAQQEEKRRAAEMAAKQAMQEATDSMIDQAAKLEASGDMDAASAMLDSAQMLAETPTAISAKTERVTGVSERTGYEITIEDPAAVPVSIMCTVIRPVDEAAVIRLVRASKGQINIPGIVVKEIKKTVLRG